MFENTKMIYGAKEFAFGMMWGAHGVRKLDVTNPKDVRIAVNKAYIDMTPRTIKGLGLKEVLDDKKLNKKLKDKIFDKKRNEINGVKEWLSEELAKVFDASKADEYKDKDTFDILHDKLCDDFVEKFKTAIGNINVELNDVGHSGIDVRLITYGKAQKIVNMSFKYLYLFDNAHNYDYIFDNCHMAIDTNILIYFKDADKVREEKSGKLKSKKVYDLTWSNMDKSDYGECRSAIEAYCRNKARAIYDEYVNTFQNELSVSSDEDQMMAKPFYAETYIFDIMMNKKRIQPDEYDEQTE